MLDFDFQPRTRLVFGAGKLDALGELGKELGGTRALLVSDPGIIAAGHSRRGLDSISRAGLQTCLFGNLQENPTTEHVAAGLAVAKDFQPDLLVGLGGGSAMDCAKGINFLYSNGGEMRDYWGVGKAKLPMLPMIAVPTTAGTGSETQSFALISDSVTHVKMACGDKKAACKVALLDPVLTVTQPQKVTALTGIDALSHALETYVTNRRSSISLAFSREAWQLLSQNFRQVLAHPLDVTARGKMQLGACYAGLAIENSMLGIAHSLANPLTARFGVPHGQAIAVMLPHVVRFNGRQVGGWYAELPLPESESAATKGEFATERLAAWLTEETQLAGLATALQELAVPREILSTLADEAAQQWTAKFNPVEASPEELYSLYEAAF